MASCSGSVKGKRGADGDGSLPRASWDVCVVLISDKDKTPVSYKALSG